MHLSPTFLPPGIPGIGDDIDRAIQHAPQLGRQSIDTGYLIKDKDKSIKIKVVILAIFVKTPQNEN
jgi:hypothetical protein